jgi:phenylpropionate dioxygenase-like ring-hydroxylating dioxygenase large terminal subunit
VVASDNQVQTTDTPARGLRSTRGPIYDAAELGFHEYWYPALLSRHLGKKPQSLKILGENLVFVRANGQPRALFDRCAHRGMPLSAGTCKAEGTITCAYHGWTFDVNDGRCVAALTDGPDSAVVGKRGKSVKSYPVEERNGIIYVYMGDQMPPPLEADVPEEMLLPGYERQAVVSVWQNNWRAAVENGYDAAHAPYVHRDSLRWRTQMRLQPAWSGHVDTVVDGPYLRQKRRRDQAGHEAVFPRVGLWPRHSWLRKALAKLGDRTKRGGAQIQEFRLPCIIRNQYWYYTHIRWAVPIDAATTRNFQVLVGPYQGARARAFRLQYWLWHRWVFHLWFNGQDREIVERLDYSAPESLFRPDSSLVALRKYIEANVRRRPVPGRQAE